MAPGVAKTFKRAAQTGLARIFEVLGGDEDKVDEVREAASEWTLEPDETGLAAEHEQVRRLFAGLARDTDRLAERIRRQALEETRRQTYQAMEALIANLNTMNSRAGAQTPFSSINYLSLIHI